MKQPYQVWTKLGDGPYKFRATYRTLDHALQAKAFWETQRGAVHSEPFYAIVRDTTQTPHTDHRKERV